MFLCAQAADAIAFWGALNEVSYQLMSKLDSAKQLTRVAMAPPSAGGAQDDS